ncbi:MAG: response regulator [bacterium]
MVDDDAGTRNALQAWLTGAGHAVALARDGPEALRRIVASVQTTESIELMVADFKMPGLNGL